MSREVPIVPADQLELYPKVRVHHKEWEMHQEKDCWKYKADYQNQFKTVYEAVNGKSLANSV